MTDDLGAVNRLVFPGNEYPRVLTFLIADIRGYTRFTVEHGDEAAARLAARFAALAREVTGAHEGLLLELRGDEILAVFPSVRQALRAAVELQGRCATASAADPSLPLPIGTGMDIGEAVPVEGGLRGAALNLAARLCSLAAPGEVLVSETVASLAGTVDGLSYIERGPTQIKGFDTAINVLQAVSEEEVSPWSGSEANTGENTQPHRVPIGGFLGAMPAGPLVAREREFHRLVEGLETARAGTGLTLLLAGEPGVGKTRLVQEIAREAHDGGFIVASGRCYEQRRTVPYYPFLEALSTAWAAAPASLQAEAPRRWPFLARLLPDQLRAHLRPSGGDSDEQELLFRAVSGFVVALTATASVALLLDDLQWADEPSLELLQHLARQTRASPVFILGIHREVTTDWKHPLEVALRNLHREDLVEQVKLSRLEEEGTTALVQAVLDDDVVWDLPRLVHRYAAGNPFFTREVLQALIERGDLYRTGQTWGLRQAEITIPDTVRSAIGERLARLDSIAQQVLEEASVLGATFTFADLWAMNDQMARCSDDALEAALDAALASRLIVEAGTDGYTFSHALVQQTIYSELTSHRRRRLHRVAGEALARLPAEQARRRASEIAWHSLEGGDQEQALRYTLLAGEEAERVFAQGEAERLYREGLVLTGRGTAADAELRWRLGRVLKNEARYDESLKMLEDADRVYRVLGKADSRLGVAAEIGVVHRMTGRLKEGIDRIEELLSTVDAAQLPLTATAQLYIPLAHLFMKSGQYEASLTAAEQAARLAQQAQEARTRAQADAIRGDALRLLGRQEEALRVLRDTVQLTQTIGDASAEFLALDAVAELLMELGELRESQRYRQQAVDLAEHMEDPAKISFELTSLGRVTFCIGDWPAARRQLEQALTVARSISTSGVNAYALLCLGEMEIGEAHWKDARHHLREAVAIADSAGSHAIELIGHALLAELDLLKDQPQPALKRLERCLSRQDLPDDAQAALLPRLAWAHLALGDQDRAASVGDRGLAAARTRQDRTALVDALRIVGMVQAEGASWDRATDAFEQAIALASDMPFPYGTARALQALGLMESRQGRIQMALQHLTRARSIFHDLGARWDAGRCDSDIARLVHDARPD